MLAELASVTKNDSDSVVWGVFTFLAFSCLFVYLLVRTLLRDRAFKRMVRERGWLWIGNASRRDLPLEELLGRSGRDVDVSNCFEGETHTIQFAALDAKVSSGRHAKSITVVAARSACNPFGGESILAAWNVTQSGEWYAIRRSEEALMSVEEVVAHIESLGVVG